MSDSGKYLLAVLVAAAAVGKCCIDKKTTRAINRSDYYGHWQCPEPDDPACCYGTGSHLQARSCVSLGLGLVGEDNAASFDRCVQFKCYATNKKSAERYKNEKRPAARILPLAVFLKPFIDPFIDAMDAGSKIIDLVWRIDSALLFRQYEEDVRLANRAAAEVKACVLDKMLRLECTDRLSPHPEDTIRMLCEHTPRDAASRPWCDVHAEIRKRGFESYSFIGCVLLLGLSLFAFVRLTRISFDL